MKKSRKFLSILLALIMAISIIPMSTITASATTYSGICGDNLTWSFDDSTGTLTISGIGAMKNYSYNSTYGDYNRPWENYKNKIKTIVINDGVTTIGNYAFYCCEYLGSITIPDSVTLIGHGAFQRCSMLGSITIPDSVTSIDDSAFFYCTQLESVIIPDSVTSIGDSAFEDCYDLTDVYYDGTEEQWKKISIGSDNSYLTNANIHFKECVHEFVDSTTIINPTCTEDGLEKRVCSECGKEETKVISALGHKYNSVVTNPTCTEKGYTTFTCHCGCSYVSDYVNANGHLYHSIITEPTCEKQGYTTFFCDCGDRFTGKYVNALGHVYNSVITPPTCTEGGYTTYACACGDTYVDDYVNATGHADNDGDGYCDADNELLDSIKNCSCNCHKSGISKFLFNFVLFFQKLFGSNEICDCGIAHY